MTPRASSHRLIRWITLGAFTEWDLEEPTMAPKVSSRIQHWREGGNVMATGKQLNGHQNRPDSEAYPGGSSCRLS